ncbi:BTB/POZ protein [Rhizophagus clarus]|uniref:BTB/POZ protein n=1 Tax=Rhizophagus clarus TaxID=94130 RepID=A0A8H3QVH7_9GLOM|nr:BTB/POZ protein [Rhizophagus clarus]
MSCQTFFDTLLRDIGNLYDKADDYNVKIQVGEDSKIEIFKAHSVILCARSKYFRTAFSSDWAKKEGDFYVFKKPNISGIVFQIILKYIYTGTVALDAVNVENNFIELLIAADEMNLYELVDHLQQSIIDLNSLNNDWIIRNGIKLFNTISRHKGVFLKLEEFCNRIMSQEPKLLIGSSEFWGLDDDALLSIIQLDDLNMKEIDIWENLIKWGILKNSSLNSDITTWNIDKYETLKETLLPFIQYIRFFQMTPQEYYYKIRPLGKLLPKELEEDLNVYYIVPDCKLATKVLPPRKHCSSIILTTNHLSLISYWIDGGKEVMPNGPKNGQYEYNLLLRGSRDGFGVKEFKLKCNNKGATIVVIKLKNPNKIIGGYNPIQWNSSGNYLNTDKSFIFSFYLNVLNTSTIILSRVVENKRAISDAAEKNQGFGAGDLYIFQKSCKLKDYSVRIHDSDNFEIDDYEVFQVLER